MKMGWKFDARGGISKKGGVRREQPGAKWGWGARVGESGTRKMGEGSNS